jgi:hypothetical protein
MSRIADEGKPLPGGQRDAQLDALLRPPRQDRHRRRRRIAIDDGVPHFVLREALGPGAYSRAPFQLNLGIFRGISWVASVPQ